VQPAIATARIAARQRIVVPPTVHRHRSCTPVITIVIILYRTAA
jgi:hypothetical protein